MSRTRPAARARRNIEIHATWHRCLCLAVMERGWLPDADVQATALFKLSHKRSQRLKTSTDTAAVVSLPVYMAQYLQAVRALALCKDTRTCRFATELALGTRCNWFRKGHITGSAMTGGSTQFCHRGLLPACTSVSLSTCSKSPDGASLRAKILSREH